jgi:hypothetical protein
MHFGVMLPAAGFMLLALAFGEVAATPHITGDWLVDIRTVLAVLGVVLPGTWWIVRWMTKIDDRLKLGEARFKGLEANSSARDKRLARIENILARLPCDKCPEDREIE